MSVSKVFLLHGISTGSSFYSQLTDAGLNTNVEDMTVTPAGHTLPMFTAENGTRPEVPYTTHQLATALAEFGLLGADPGVCVLRLRAVANQGTRADNASGTHITYTCNNVLGYLQSISASNRQHATASIRLALLKDASNAAYIYSGAANISGTQSAGENFILGPIAHNGTVITGTDDFSLELNPTVLEPEQEFDSEPTFAAIENIRPTLSFVTTDVTAWSLHRVALTNSVKVNLLKKTPNGDRYGDGTSNHIKFVATSGRIVCENVQGNRSLVRVRVYAVSSDGTTSPVVATVNTPVDTAVEI